MEKGLFHELYKRSCELEIRDCPLPALSGFLHGFLSVYSMIRVYPWLEEMYGEAYEVHKRAREIARIIEPLAVNKDLPAETRAGYAVDLMDAYQLYSTDLTFLNTALDVAYELLTPKGAGKMVLPCRTPNVCRMLCNCYYFTGDAACGELAGHLITEMLGYTRDGLRGDLFSWWDAIGLYDDVIGMMELPLKERRRLSEERVRLQVWIVQLEDERIERFRHGDVGEDLRFEAEVFHILAKRAFVECNELYGRWK